MISASSVATAPRAASSAAPMRSLATAYSSTEISVHARRRARPHRPAIAPRSEISRPTPWVFSCAAGSVCASTCRNKSGESQSRARPTWSEARYAAKSRPICRTETRCSPSPMTSLRACSPLARANGNRYFIAACGGICPDATLACTSGRSALRSPSRRDTQLLLRHNRRAISSSDCPSSLVRCSMSHACSSAERARPSMWKRAISASLSLTGHTVASTVSRPSFRKISTRA